MQLAPLAVELLHGAGKVLLGCLHMWSLPSPRTPQGALSGSYASYEARRAECVWREVEVPQILRSLRAIAGKPQNVFSTPEVVVHGSRAHECQVRADGPDGEAMLLVRRYGLPSTGGAIDTYAGHWHNWAFQLAFPKEWADADGAAHATSYFLWGVAPNGSAHPFPPLHNHHAAYKTGSTRGRLPPWLKNFKPAWHTAAPGSAPDSWCASERGGSGAECVLKQLPPGNAFKVLPGTYSIIINDVREQIDAPPYALYYETAYRLLRPAAPVAVVRHLDWFMHGTCNAQMRAVGLATKRLCADGVKTINGTMCAQISMAQFSGAIRHRAIRRRNSLRRHRAHRLS